MNIDYQDRRIVIAVPTFRRTKLLAALLTEIRNQTMETGMSARIVVIDNDSARSAEPVAIAQGVGYACETRPGIAAARQRALDEAQSADAVVMIDDDLFPEQGWLRDLVDVWCSSGADVVMGFVRYVWPKGTDPWIAAGGFMRRDRHPSGTRLKYLATGNVLIDVNRVNELGVRFDLGLGLAGGEDTQFGRELLARGGLIVAAASVARDDVPAERTTREFVKRRSIAHGQTRSRLYSRGNSAPERLLRRGFLLSGGLVRLVVFEVGALWTLIRGDMAGNAVMRRRSWFARGRVLGALGRVTSEYARNE